MQKDHSNFPPKYAYTKLMNMLEEFFSSNNSWHINTFHCCNPTMLSAQGFIHTYVYNFIAAYQAKRLWIIQAIKVQLHQLKSKFPGIIPISLSAHSAPVPLPIQLSLLWPCETSLTEDPGADQFKQHACHSYPSIHLTTTFLYSWFCPLLSPTQLPIISWIVCSCVSGSGNILYPGPSAPTLHFCIIVSVQIRLIIMYMLTLGFTVD